MAPKGVTQTSSTWRSLREAYPRIAAGMVLAIAALLLTDIVLAYKRVQYGRDLTRMRASMTETGRVPHVGKRLPRVAWGTRGLFPLADIEKSAEAPGFNIYASAQYRDFPREDFYGIGATSLQLDRTDYRLQDGLYEGIVRYRVSSLSFMARAGLLQASIRPGTDSAFPDTGISNDEGTAPGLYEAGKVFSTMREFDVSNMLRSWGGGIRLKSPREVRFRLDVLHSPEGTRLDVKLGQSF